MHAMQGHALHHAAGGIRAAQYTRGLRARFFIPLVKNQPKRWLNHRSKRSIASWKSSRAVVMATGRDGKTTNVYRSLPVARATVRVNLGKLRGASVRDPLADRYQKTARTITKACSPSVGKVSACRGSTDSRARSNRSALSCASPRLSRALR